MCEEVDTSWRTVFVKKLQFESLKSDTSTSMYTCSSSMKIVL